MKLFVGFLTFVLVLDCVFMMLLILIQLPKKEAGLGTAFGSGATDALFGAGKGTALTNLTKYAAGIFLGLAMLLSVLIGTQVHQKGPGVDDVLRKEGGASAVPLVPTLAAASNLVEQASPSTSSVTLPTAPAELVTSNVLVVPPSTNAATP